MNSETNESNIITKMLGKDLPEIEKALSDVLASGYGVVEIIVDRGQVTGFKKTISEKFGKFKSKAP